MFKSNNIIEMVINLEKRLLESEVRVSREEIGNLVADEFIEFCTSGVVCNKKEMLNELPNSEPIEIKAYDFNSNILAEDIVLITYYTCNVNTGIHAMRSSIWKLINDRWQLIFHQGTKLKN